MAATALKELDLDRLWPSWSTIDKFAYLVVALGAAAPVLNADPSFDESDESMEERSVVQDVLELFLNQLKSNLHRSNATVLGDNSKHGLREGSEGESENSDYDPEEEVQNEARSAAIKTRSSRVTRASRAAASENSPRKKQTRPSTIAEETPSKRKTRADTAAEEKASPTKRKVRADHLAEISTPSKKRRVK